MKTFRTIVREALDACGLVVDSDELALALDRGLKLEGIGLHDLATCEPFRRIVKDGPTLGREMTRAERIAVEQAEAFAESVRLAKLAERRERRRSAA